MYGTEVLGAPMAWNCIGYLGKVIGGLAPSSTLLNSLVSYWPLNEQSGTREDAVGSNDLTDNNTVGASNRGPDGTVASFVAANSESLSVAGHIITKGITKTLAFWFNVDSIGTEQGLATTGANPGDANATFFLRVSGSKISLFIGTIGYFAGSTTLSQGWHLCEYSFEDTVGHKVYVDGILEISTVSGDVGTTDDNLYFGSSFAGFAQGKEAETGVWYRLLSPAERTSLFNSGNGKKYADLSTSEKVGLVSYWNLDEVSGTRVDSHGSNDLTDNNTVGSVNSGPEGAVASFVAANSEELTATSSDFLKVGSDWAFGGWVKTRVGQSYAGALGVYSYLINTGAGFAWRQDGAGGFEEYAGHVVAATIASVGLSNWVYLLARYNTTTEMLSHSVNGAPFVAEYAKGPGLLDYHTMRLASIELSGYFGDVDLSRVGIWTRQLNDVDAASLFAAGTGKRYADLTTAEKVDLISYWNLDETGGTRLDSHGSNDLTDNNTVGSVINAGGAMDGAAATFVAANSEALERATITLPTSYSTAAWIKTAGSTSAAAVYCGSAFPNSVQIALYTENATTLRVLVGDGSGFVFADGVVTPSEWHLAIATYDDASKKVGLSIDGGAVILSNALAGTRDATPATLKIGGQGLVPFYEGLIDEVAIWDRVLTEDERTELFNAGAGKFYPFPV